MTIADSKMHRFTRAEYYRMAADGYFENQRVELLGGEILDMSPQNHPHAWTISFITHLISKHLPENCFLRCQLPLAVSDVDEPEPDFAVIQGRLEDLHDHPTTAVLVIEIADDSLARDRRKAELYARAGVEEYWIVNLRSREIIQHVQPARSNDGSGRYISIRTVTADELVTCAVIPLPALPVKDLLPPVTP